MPRKVDSRVAEAEMLVAGAQPLEPYKNTSSPWKCECLNCGNIISPSLASIRKGQGACAYCAGNKVDPEQAKQRMLEAHLTPLVPYPGAGAKWLCLCEKCGQEVSPSYSNVRSGHSGCRFCIGNFADEAKARRLFLDRGLAPLEPYSNARKPWKSLHIDCGQIVQPTFNSVQQGSSGCAYCAGNLAILEVEALQILESRGYQAQESFPGARYPWAMKHLKCGRIVKPSLSTLKRSVIGCAYCANIKVDPLEAENYVRSIGMTPLASYPGSSSPWPLIHRKCGLVINPTYNSLQQGSGCAYCAKNRVDPEKAKKVMLDRGLLPQAPFPGSNKPWPCTHLFCGNQVSPKYRDVLQGSRGCRHCASTYVDEHDALVVFQSAGLEPQVPYPGSATGWQSIHLACGKMVSPRYGYVRRFGTGCGFCAGRRVDAGEAEVAMKAVGLTPLEPYPGKNNVPWKCLHIKCGKEVQPRYNSIQGGQGGCQFCANSGFDFEAPSYFYVITHPELSAHKIGIGSIDSKRIERHKQLGWLEYKSLSFSTGKQAFELEQNVLGKLREEWGLFPFLTKRDMPQGGWTETIDASEISLNMLWREVELCTLEIK